MFESKAAKAGSKASAMQRFPIVRTIILQQVVREDPSDVREGVETWIARNPNVLAGT